MGQEREKNPNWKGGRTVDQRGYVLVKVGKGHHLADCRGYAYEHRLKAEEMAGRQLAKGEEVHHDDEQPSNNDDGNLILTSSHAEHFVHHRKRIDLRLPGEPNPTISCACGCGAEFHKYDAHNRPRQYVSGHNMRRRKP